MQRAASTAFSSRSTAKNVHAARRNATFNRLDSTRLDSDSTPFKHTNVTYPTFLPLRFIRVVSHLRSFLRFIRAGKHRCNAIPPRANPRDREFRNRVILLLLSSRWKESSKSTTTTTTTTTTVHDRFSIRERAHYRRYNAKTPTVLYASLSLSRLSANLCGNPKPLFSLSP